MEPIHREQLTNGLVLIVAEEHTLPIVCSTIWYRVGSRDEEEGRTGLAHFLEHLMFKGTRKYPKGSIDEISLRLGGNNNAFTSYDYTGYYFTFAADRWEVALDIERDRMCRLLLDPEEFQAEKQVVLEELNMGEDNPWEFLRRHVYALAYQRHPYRHPIIGWKEDLTGLKRDDLSDFYRRNYQPGNALLVVTGDVKTAEVSRLVRQRFEKIPGRHVPCRSIPPDSPPEGVLRMQASRPGKVTRILSAFCGPAVSSPDIHAVNVLRYLLAEGKSSRLYQRLVERDQLASSFSVHFEDMLDPSLFTMAAELRDGIEPRQLEEALFDEFGRLQRDGIPPAELERAKRQLEADYIFDLEDISNLAVNLGMYECIASAGFFLDFPSKIRAVRGEEIIDAARRVLTPDHCVLASLEAERRGAMVWVEEEPEEEEYPDSRCHYRPVNSAGPGRKVRRAGCAAVHLPVREYTLDNGLTVLLCPLPRIPAAVASAIVLCGSREDPPGREGLAHLMGNMLDEGTSRRTHDEIALLVDGMGGMLDTYADRESAGISLKLLREDLPAGLELLRELVMDPVFPEDRLELLRAQVLTRIASLEDRPDYLVAQEFNRLVYQSTPLASPTHGTRDTVLAIGREELAEFHRRYFHPSNLVLVLAGDLDPEAVMPLLRQAWAGLPGGKAPDRPDFGLRRQTMPQQRRLTVPDKAQHHIMMGHLGVRRNHPDIYRLMVLDVILGGGPGFTSRIPRTLRDEMGLAYHTYAAISANASLDEGLFTAYIGTSPEHRDRALAAMTAEIKRIRDELVTADELQAAKDFLTGNFVFKFETMSQVASFMLAARVHGLGFDYPALFPGFIEEVTLDDIREAARRHLNPDAMTVVEAGPEA